MSAGVSAIYVLLILRADDPQHADRAWQRMATWSPAVMPSGLDEQINDAIRLTKVDADPFELSKWDQHRLDEDRKRGRK